MDFITHNIILNTNETFFKYKLITSEKSFIKAYPHWIAVKEIFKIWLSKIDSILYKPDKNLNIYEYKNEYKTKNRNIFNRTREKYLYFLTHGDLAYEEDTFYENKDDEDYLKQIVDNGKDTLDRFYNLSFLEVIEIYINKKSFWADQFYEYWKYWLDFYKFYKTNIHRIDYKVEVDMEKIMKVIQ